MLRILAMVGDADASAHLWEAVSDVARLQVVREVNSFSQHIGRDLPDVLVLGVKEAELPGARAIAQDAIARRPRLPVFLVMHMDSPETHALAGLQYLRFLDIILPHQDSPAWTRRRLLEVNPACVGDMCLRRLVCSRAPNSVLHLVNWCIGHDGAVRPTVRALAALEGVRPETLVRRFAAFGVCLPNHLISWVIVLRAKVWLDTPETSLEDAAHAFGLASGGALANLIRRRTGLTLSEFRGRTLEEIAAHAVREMFGACSEPGLRNPPNPIDLQAS